MYQIKENITNTVVINKSEFITVLKKINNLDDVNNEIKKIKEEYRDATHYCYAYILDDLKKSSDDGEPGGTAGIPILEILIKNNLTNVLCVVVRYFGGIKLGASGLIRAYSRSCRDAINKATLLKVIPSKIYKIEFVYSNAKTIDNILKNESIIKKDYNQNVVYEINIIDDNTINKLKLLCTNIDFIEDSIILK